MSVQRGSEVIIIDIEDAKNIVEGYRLLLHEDGRKKLSSIGCLESFNRLTSCVREYEQSIGA